MQKIIIIGNLGADAQIQDYQGKKFLTFRVACSEKYTSNGQEQVSTQWYDITSQRVESGIIPYLVKAAKVCIIGRPTYRIYDSQVHRCKMVGVSIFAENIELCGSAQPTAQSNTAGQPAAQQAGEGADEAAPF